MCHIEDILLEMDQILRLEGAVLFRGEVNHLIKVKKIVEESIGLLVQTPSTQ